MDENGAIRSLVLIGESAVDVALYISKICSFNQKVLFLDLSSEGIVIDIVSPDGHMENQSIHYSKHVNTSEVYDYDLVIVFSDKIRDIPSNLCGNDVYVFINSRKSSTMKLFKEINSIENVFIVYRGKDSEDIVLKRIYVSEIAQGTIGRVLFIKDNDDDSQVFRQMEYSSVFLYDNLSDELKMFLSNIYRRVANKCFTARDTEEVRFKWVM